MRGRVDDFGRIYAVNCKTCGGMWTIETRTHPDVSGGDHVCQQCGAQFGVWINGGTLDLGIVRDAKMTPIMDYAMFTDRSIQRDYGRHGLSRVLTVTHGRSQVRHYWHSIRVPWIVWGLFR